MNTTTITRVILALALAKLDIPQPPSDDSEAVKP